MSRILAYTSRARGHLFPLVPILDELRRRDHEVALRTLSSEVGLMRSRGLDAGPIAPAIEAIEFDDWRARSAYGAAKRLAATFSAWAEHDAPDLQSAIARERPDALLVDIASWGALSAAEDWGGPWAAFLPYPLMLRSREAPPFGPGWRPARGPLGRSRDRFARSLFPVASDRVLNHRLAEIRERHGLAPLRHFEELFLKPPLLLYMTAEPFEYRRSNWPPNIVMVGPCSWDPPAQMPPELSDVEAPLVLVTTSSEFQNDGSLVRAALEGLAQEPYHVVATLPTVGAEGLRPPANATLLRFTPHAPILARAACAITHGGMGATQKALAQGVPVCAVPFGRDQLEVARRVEVAGAGTRLAAQRLRPDLLREKVYEAISRKAGAERVARAFAAIGGTRIAADAFEQRLLSN